LTLKNVTTPDFGSNAEVTVTDVLVKVGDVIEKDSPIVTLESDKATMDIPSSEAGRIKEIKVKVGDHVSTGSVILVVEEGAGAESQAPSHAQSETAPIKEAQSHQTQSSQTHTSAAHVESRSAQRTVSGTLQKESDVHAGPGVRRLAHELGVNLSAVQGTGPKQRVLKEDVEAYAQHQSGGMPSGPAMMSLPAIDFSQYGETSIEPLSRIKKISGKYLQRNWMMIPHVTQFGEADITTLDAYRVSQNDVLQKYSIKLTPLVFVIKAVVASLKAFPEFNASLDSSSEHLVLKKYFNIGVAVDTSEGLVVPVIRDVDKKGLVDLAKELADTSEKAREKQLMPMDLQGSSFSISSLGGIGGTAFTPIINYPDVAILGVSKAFYKPVYEDGQFVPRLMLPLSLSYDHRVIDGADAARFIVHLTTMLSDIRNLLL
jgi:pyruvate dehydrogenase E2 component (dihydrolipoamide acetyltransferase)